MDNNFPKQRSDISTRVLEGETVVLHLAAEQIHQFNATASFVWNRCDGHRTAAEIAEELTGFFDVDYKTAHDAVVTTLRQLDELRLLDHA